MLNLVQFLRGDAHSSRAVRVLHQVEGTNKGGSSGGECHTSLRKVTQTLRLADGHGRRKANLRITDKRIRFRGEVGYTFPHFPWTMKKYIQFHLCSDRRPPNSSKEHVCQIRQIKAEGIAQIIFRGTAG